MGYAFVYVFSLGLQLSILTDPSQRANQNKLNSQGFVFKSRPKNEQSACIFHMVKKKEQVTRSIPSPPPGNEYNL